MITKNGNKWIFEDEIKSINGATILGVLNVNTTKHSFTVYEKELADRIISDYKKSKHISCLFNVIPNSFTGNKILSGKLIDFMSFY